MTGVAAGLHAGVALAEPVDVAALQAACERCSVRVYDPRPDTLFLGYAGRDETTAPASRRRARREREWRAAPWRMEGRHPWCPIGILAAGVAVLALLLLAPASASAARNSLLPWPSDAYTRPGQVLTDWGTTPEKAGTRCGARNAKGVPIAPGPYNASDGFSPGQTIVVRIPGLDTAAAFKKTGLVPQTDLARYADKNQPLVVIDAKTRKRHLVWAEADSNATKDSERVLLVHPGANWGGGPPLHRRAATTARGERETAAAPKGRKPAKLILATLEKAGVNVHRPL